MLGCQAVSEPEVGMDEAPAWHRSLQLHAQPADVHVHRPIPLSKLSTPGESAQMLARHDSIGVSGELRQQAQFPGRKQKCPAAHPCEVLRREDLERADPYYVGVRLRSPKR